MSKKWSPPEAPPAPMFFGKKEKDLVKQINDELIEKVIGQTILYFPVSTIHTDYHPLYGEAIVKNFLNPIKVNALVDWQGSKTTTTNYGIDRLSSITIHFHKRRLTEDQNLFVREGDFVKYGKQFYEIIETGEPKLLFGQIDHSLEISAICKRAREGLFDGK